jgi:hypothetical protein
VDLRSGDVMCGLCGGRVRLIPGNYVKVTGWVEIRSRGGANAVRAQSAALAAAHKMCVDHLVRGEARAQQLTFPRIEER